MQKLLPITCAAVATGVASNAYAVVRSEGGGGTVATSGNVPSSWSVLVRANSLVLKKLSGTVITIK